MSRETLSTARTSPPPFPPNGDEACVKTFVILRTSISGTLLMLAASAFGTRVVQRDTSSRRDQWHRRQSGQQSDKFPAAEVFFQDVASQRSSDGGVKRMDHAGFVPPPELGGINEECTGEERKHSGHHAEEPPRDDEVGCEAN